MSNFMIASYSLQIKDIYDDIKDGIPAKLKGSYKKNLINITKYSLPSLQKAYKIGVKFATAYASDSVKIKPKPKIGNRDRRRLMEEFILRVKGAEEVAISRLNTLRKINKLNGTRLDLKDGSQEMIIKNEYDNTVKKSVNILIINAGTAGQFQVWNQIKPKKERAK